MIIKTTRDFVVNELYPHEAEIEETGILRHDLRDQLKKKAIEAGLYAANMPAEVGGAGLDTLTWVLYEKELGRANYACTGRAWHGPPTSSWPATPSSAKSTFSPPSAAKRATASP